MSETGVKSDPAFCLGPTIKKTNSEANRQLREIALPPGEKKKHSQRELVES